MLREPRAYEPAAIDREVITKQVNERDGLGRGAVELLEPIGELRFSLPRRRERSVKFEALPAPFALDSLHAPLASLARLANIDGIEMPT
jgi:hypothetical protein